MSGILGGLVAAAGAVPINFGPGTDQSTVASPGTSSAAAMFNTDGTITGSGVDSAFNGQWITPTGGTPGNAWQVRATLTGGTTPSAGTMGSYLALSSARTWTNTQSVNGTKTSTILFEISPDGVTAVASGTITIVATRTP